MCKLMRVMSTLFVTFGLITIFGDSLTAQQTANKSVASAKVLIQTKPRIEIKKSVLYANGSAVKLPIPMSEFQKIFGAPSRTADKLNRISTWDSLGLLAYQKTDSSDVYQLSVILNNSEMEFEFWPKNAFKGTLNIDGAKIDSGSTDTLINRTKTGIKFKRVSPLTPFLAELNVGHLQINISRALRGNFSASGKIVEVSIAILEN